MERLFVYGTLGPGRPNEHILLKIGGTWQPASVRLANSGGVKTVILASI